ncbi:TPA: hypothetical protein I8235_000957 [Kluyvera intermedia]|nr:hypothetical protein [Kluyvera intermedia]
MKAISILFVACGLLASSSVLALDANDLSDLEGYTIAKTTKVDGDFEGCDYGKKIALMNGWSLTCNTYHYSYSYMPAVVILSRAIGPGYSIKAVIGDYVYDMEPVSK